MPPRPICRTRRSGEFFQLLGWRKGNMLPICNISPTTHQIKLYLSSSWSSKPANPDRKHQWLGPIDQKENEDETSTITDWRDSSPAAAHWLFQWPNGPNDARRRMQQLQQLPSRNVSQCLRNRWLRNLRTARRSYWTRRDPRCQRAVHWTTRIYRAIAWPSSIDSFRSKEDLVALDPEVIGQ